MKIKLLSFGFVAVVILAGFSIVSSYSCAKSQRGDEVEKISSGQEYGYPVNIYTYEDESQENNVVVDDVELLPVK